jgi:hypothetical protein
MCHTLTRPRSGLGLNELLGRVPMLELEEPGSVAASVGFASCDEVASNAVQLALKLHGVGRQ